MIVNIRGTHGSGKSTAVVKIMELHPYRYVAESDPKGKALVYRLRRQKTNNDAKDIFVIGRYDTACGGCDGIQPYERIWPLVDKYGALGYNVLFEGALVSSSYGNIGRASEAYGDKFVFAFMDTPLETCLKRIVARRAARGNFKELDPSNTEFKFDAVNKSYAKIVDVYKRRVAVIDHREPVKGVMKLFGVRLRKEPA